MNFMGKLADRLLSTVVPEIKASACCGKSGTHYTNICGCIGGEIKAQTCTYNCNCKVTCGACLPIGATC